MAKYTGPDRPCHDCAEMGIQRSATENLGMRLKGPRGERKLGLFCTDCANERLGKGPKITWAQLDAMRTPPVQARGDNFAAGHKKNEPEETLPPPTLFDE